MLGSCGVDHWQLHGWVAAFTVHLYPYSLRRYSFFKGTFAAILTTYTSDDKTTVIILNQICIDMVLVAVNTLGLSHNITSLFSSLIKQ
jgi:hypothetical protein